MEIDENIAREINEKLENANNILIISHRSPDPDCLGSNLALRFFLGHKGKNVVSACIDQVPVNYLFFTELNKFVTAFDPENFDLIVTLDCGSLDQVGFPAIYPQMIAMGTPWINIDHHPSNNHFGTINLVVDDAAATTLIMYGLFKTLNRQLDPYTASCLLFGLYYDTGSFMHSSTDEQVLTAAADLLAHKANLKLIISKLYKNKSVEQLRIWGKALSNAHVTENGVIVTGILEKDFAECNANSQDLSGLIDYLCSARDVKFATILSHDSNGNVRGSLRTRRDDVNVSQIAKNFGGGGHKKASGFTLKGKLNKKTYWSITSD